MKTKTITQSAILLAIGTILHLLPGFVNMVKPDFMLVCVFTIIFLNDDFKVSLAVGVAGGILAGMTTHAPGGFLPNVADKIVASVCVYLLSKILINNKINQIIGKGLLYFIGTAISGFVFLSLMAISGALPENSGVISMFFVLVIPTALINIVVGLFFDKLTNLYEKRLSRA